MPQFITCPKCHNKYWSDIPNIDNPNIVRFRCTRCSYVFKPGQCSTCKTKNWKIEKGIQTSTAHRPWYRLRCLGCQKSVGIYINNPF